MKKIILGIALSILFVAPAYAVNVEVEALSDFSTDNPPQTYSVKIVNPVSTKQGIIEGGSIVEGKIMAKGPKRLKQDATFTFIPTYLVTPEGTVIKAKRNYIAKYKKEIDKGAIAKTAVLSAGNFAVKGFSTGYKAIEGAVKNEEGNRLKSTAVAVYNSTPISYIEKGNALVIKKGEHFYMSFKLDDSSEDYDEK